MCEEKKVGGLRDIDAEKINRVVEEVNVAAIKLANIIGAIYDRGVIVEPTILGCKLSIAIRLGPTEDKK